MPAPRHTVLIAEDNLTLLPLYEALLAQSGFKVITAHSGGEALDLYQFLHMVIDLVVCDLSMPEMDGPTTLAAMHRLHPEMRCFLLDDGSMGFDELALQHCGCLGVINKPLQVPYLSRILRQAVDNDCRSDHSARAYGYSHPNPVTNEKIADKMSEEFFGLPVKRLRELRMPEEGNGTGRKGRVRLVE